MRARPVVAVALAVASLGPFAAAQDEPPAVAEIRRQLVGLAQYGVFDYLSFDYEKGTLTLGGYVSDPSLKDAAQKAVERIEGVEQVTNRIQALPNMPSDDDLRWAIYRAIYRDSPLSRYGSADDEMATSRPGAPVVPARPGRGTSAPRQPERLFLREQPIGRHAIHIIVYNGNVMLSGLVDTTEDKRLAELKTKGVFGVRKVVNDLAVTGQVE